MTALNEVELILARLDGALTEEDLVSGWTNESQEAAKQYFQTLRSALIANQPLPPLGIIRGLDHRGVVGGELLDEIARVTNLLRKLGSVHI